MNKTVTFSIMQNGLEVAGGCGLLKDCQREAQHYAYAYRQEGPVEIYIDGVEVKNDKAN